MKKNSKKFFKSINKKIVQGFFALLVFVINFLCWIFEPDLLVPLWSLLLLIIFAWFVWLITYSICHKEKEDKYSLPEVRGINNSNEVIRIIMDYSDFFSIDSLVSIYYLDDEMDIETFIGVGYVETRNLNNYFQIIILSLIDSDIRLVNDSKTKRCLIIKPSIPKKYIGEMYDGNW